MNRGTMPLGGDKTSISGLAEFNGQTPTYGTVAVYDPPTGKFKQRKGSRWNAPLSTYNLDGASLPNWREACTKLRLGTANPVIAEIGDSTTIGAATSGIFPTSHPARLGAMIQAKSGSALPFREAPVGPVVSNSAPTDARISAGTGWAFQSQTSGFVATNTTSGTLAITPLVSFDTISVKFARNTGLGTAPINVDGGADLGSGVVTAGAAGIGTTTFTVAAGTHTINILPLTSGTFVEILAVEVYTAATKTGQVWNLGVGAQKITDYVAATAASWSWYNWVTHLAPDVTFMNFTINDYAARTNLSTYKTNMQQAITQARVSGDVILMTGVPGSGLLPFPGYRETLYDLADENSCPLIDFIDRWTNFTISNAGGYYTDTQHPSAGGHMDIAAAQANVLLAVA